MFKLSDIKEIVRLVDKSSIHELEIESEGTRLYISKPKLEAVATVQAPLHTAPVQHVYSDAASVASAAATAPVSETTAAEPANNTDNLVKITSPMVGTFYAASAPGAASFVQKGDRVTPSSVVCIVEAMKLMNEIEAEVSGEIVEVLVENAQLVEYGQPLFLVKPE